ncbi:hypothetical protein C8R45DRAFT_947212 [Mycena sanguinolenta]|nr:hypothetical protein C8R45DRAFT_947212 [Mycena sanguinolenta]
MSSLLWPLGAVSACLFFSLVPIGSPVDRANHPSLYPRAGNSLEGISNDSDPDYQPFTPGDVFQVRRCLLNDLPPELVSTILDEAKYWPRIRSTINRLLVVHASSSSDNKASLRCLVTPPFPASQALRGPSTRLRVKLQVKFDIVSNDQGWGNDPQDHGSYIGSYTCQKVAEYCQLDLYSKSQTKRAGRDLDGWYRPTGVQLSRRRRTALCGATGMESTNGDREENGGGDGAGFIELLAPEDYIGIVARARVRFSDFSAVPGN